MFHGVVKLPMDLAGPFIPQQMYKPRTTDEVLLTGPLFFYSDNPTRSGIPLKDALLSSKRLHNRHKPVFEDCSPRVSIRLKVTVSSTHVNIRSCMLQWPGYKQWSRQIPTKDPHNPSRPMTLANLAKWVARCVQRFIRERKFVPVEDGFHRWKIGDGQSDIKFEDLILVSLHHVSLGSWQPQLRLVSPNEVRPSRSTTVVPCIGNTLESRSDSEVPSSKAIDTASRHHGHRPPILQRKSSCPWMSHPVPRTRSQSPAAI
jgi:hypothetical protein